MAHKKVSSQCKGDQIDEEEHALEAERLDLEAGGQLLASKAAVQHVGKQHISLRGYDKGNKAGFVDF